MQQLTQKKKFKEDWSDTDDTALIIISIKYFSKREREREVSTDIVFVLSTKEFIQ